MKIGSLFSGGGGLDLAVAAVFGGETVWHCEVDPAASKVLAARWPGVPNLGDITEVNWGALRFHIDDIPGVSFKTDIICAGWPCQPFSLAGKRKGSDDKRALWPHVEYAIRVVRPRIVVLENVTAVLGPEFQRVANGLAALGYDIAWTCLRAADVGAPHWRNRFFAVATNADFDGLEEGQLPSRPAPEIARDHSGFIPLPDATHNGREWSRQAWGRRSGPEDRSSDVVWGRYGPAVRQWEALTRPAPSPTEPTRERLRRRLNPQFAEWMLGWPAGWVTDVLGLTRSDMFRIIGNGVCPQQAHAAIQSLLSVCAVAA